MLNFKHLLAAALLLGTSLGVQAERLKDIASISGVRSNQLIGYGLVVGLDGTGDTHDFVVADGINYVRKKGKTGVTSKDFKNNPIFDPIRNQGKELGHCSKKAFQFRQLAARFNKLAKDGSVAGRINKLLLEILQELVINLFLN